MVLFPEIPNIVVLLFWVLILVLLVVLIDSVLKFGNKFIGALANSKTTEIEEINTKMELIVQRMQSIESKIDKISRTLEKVSDREK